MSATSQVFGSQNLSEQIFEFLPLEDRLACRNATRDITNNAVAALEPSRKVFAVRPLRELILACLSPQDLDLSRRIKRSFNRNITEFQRVRLPGHFPEELRGIVKGARFQFENGFIRFGLPASVVVGYSRGMPFLACNTDMLAADGKITKVYDHALKRPDGTWFIDGARNATIVPRYAHMSDLIEFIHTGSYIPESALPAPRSRCQRIRDLFRKLCCCPPRPEKLYPQFRLCYPELRSPNEPE